MTRQKQYDLWDLPTRLFHLYLIIAIPLSWWSAEEGNYDLHQWLGYMLIVLVIGRIAWGFVGSRHARFSDFLVGPAGVWAYLKGRGITSVGHNPLGGWSVVVLLSLLLLQGVSGLFNTDDILFNGPLYYAAGEDFRGAMGVLHDLAFDALLVMVGLHIAAVLYHQFARRERLIQAMIRGRAEGREGRSPSAPWWWALVITSLVAALLWWGLEQAPQPQPLW